jgi:hypothetical protein
VFFSRQTASGNPTGGSFNLCMAKKYYCFLRSIEMELSVKLVLTASVMLNLGCLPVIYTADICAVCKMTI